MDNDNKLCDKCGLRPQQKAQPKPCACKPKKCCKKKDCCNDNEFAFRKVVIPASLGDDVTGQDKPENGAYTNSYVEYEANGAQYMYDSYGVYTKIEGGGGGGGTLDFNQLENRPKYAGERMTGDTDIPDVDAAVAGLQTQINGKQNTLTQTQLDAVNSGIDTTKVNQIATNTSEITTIEGKIPTQASSSNQLADKNFVNSSIATNTAYYISDNGQPFQSLADLEAYSGTLTNNDYAFVVGTDAQGNTVYDRYKYNASTQQWAFEYELNNSSFTAAQWAAINSGIASGDVTKLAGLADIRSVGSNLTLDPATGTLSATDTTYTDFVGTDGVDAGSAGLVPAPATTDAGKFLKADGTWDSVSAGPTVVQTTGTSQTDVMSQKATSQMVFQSGYESSQGRIAIGSGANASGASTSYGSIAIGVNSYAGHNTAVTIGKDSVANAQGTVAVGDSARAGFGGGAYNGATAIGHKAYVKGTGTTAIGASTGGTNDPISEFSVLLGYGSRLTTSRDYTVSVGSGAATNGTRYIANVTDPTLPQDAATKNYVDTKFTYSTTEQAIGTWIDGKPLYRRVFSGTTDSGQNTYLDIVSSSDEFNLVSVSGNINRTDGYNICFPYGSSPTDYAIAFKQTVDVYKLRINTSANHSSCAYNIIVEYTKASD